MRLAVMGANGRTGLKVVELALRRGHEVTAVARRPEGALARDGQLTTAQADASTLTRSVRPSQAAALRSRRSGSAPRAPRQSSTPKASPTVLAAKDAHVIVDLAVVSAAPAGPRDEGFLERRLAMPILDRLFGATYEDMRRMEARLDASDVDWVALRRRGWSRSRQRGAVAWMPPSPPEGT